MSDLTDADQETLHQMQHLADVLDQSWPGIATWNAAVKAEGGEDTKAWLRRKKKEWR